MKTNKSSLVEVEKVACLRFGGHQTFEPPYRDDSTQSIGPIVSRGSHCYVATSTNKQLSINSVVI